MSFERGGDKLYDTIGIKSPYISKERAVMIHKKCLRKECIDLSTGELIYQITTGSLEGSFDARISIRVDNKEWKIKEKPARTIIVHAGDLKALKVPELVETQWFVYVEASVHKAMLGHNIYGGPTDIRHAIAWLIKKVEELLEVDLPFYGDWEVKRVDVAEVFELSSFKACQEWFSMMTNTSFPRRQVYRFGDCGLYAQGSSTTVKFYHKGVEFVKHDRKRLKRFLKESVLSELIEKANCIIRTEVEIWPKKFEYDFGHSPKVSELNDKYFKDIYDKEVKKLLKEGDKSMKIVRRTKAVEMRLFKTYDERLAGILFGMWLRLSSVGEKAVKETVSKRTFYRNRKLLIEAGVSWNGTDIVKTIELVPEDFSPVSTDKRRIDVSTEEAKQHLFKKAI